MDHVWVFVSKLIMDTDDLLTTRRKKTNWPVLVRFLHSEDGRIAETKVHRLYPNVKQVWATHG